MNRLRDANETPHVEQFHQPSPLGFLFLLFAASLAVFATLMLLGAGGVAEGQNGACCPQAADAETTLEVCLESVVPEISPGGVRSRVVVNREITAADRPAESDDPDLYDRMACDDPSDPGGSE